MSSNGVDVNVTDKRHEFTSLDEYTTYEISVYTVNKASLEGGGGGAGEPAKVNLTTLAIGTLCAFGSFWRIDNNQ